MCVASRGVVSSEEVSSDVEDKAADAYQVLVRTERKERRRLFGRSDHGINHIPGIYLLTTCVDLRSLLYVLPVTIASEGWDEYIF